MPVADDERNGVNARNGVRLGDNGLQQSKTGTCRSALLLIGGAFLSAILSAAIVFAVLVGAVPTLVAIFGLGQGVLCGLGLRAALRLARVRSGQLAFASAIFTGVLAALGVYFGLYLRELWDMERAMGASPSGALRAICSLDAPRLFSIALTLPATGHSGFLGYMLLKARESASFVNVLAIHVAATALLSWMVARRELCASPAADQLAGSTTTAVP